MTTNASPKFKNNTKWGTELLACSNKLYYWSMKASKLKGKKILEVTLTRVLKQTGLKDNYTYLKEVEKRRQEVRKGHRIGINKTKERRLADLQERAHTYATEGNFPTEKALQDILIAKDTK